MGVYTDESKLVIITVPNLAKNVKSSLKHETDHIIKNNDCLVQYAIKNN